MLSDFKNSFKTDSAVNLL